MKAALTLFGMAAALSVGAALVDGVAAKVGSDTILRSDVLGEMKRMNAEDSRYTEFRNLLIERKLILKAAAEAKMTMQEWVIENRVREIVNRSFGGDRNRLMEVLSQQKVSYPEWYAKLKEDMIVAAMRWQIIDKNIVASPAEMRREYSEHAERYRAGHKVSFSVILLRPEDAPKRNEIDQKLKNVPFEDLARLYSVDEMAKNGGKWVNVDPRESFKPEICEEIEKMPKGTVSHWIELDGWSFLVRKDGATDVKTKSFEEAYDEIEKNVKDEKANAAYAAWIERLKEGTYIKAF